MLADNLPGQPTRRQRLRAAVLHVGRLAVFVSIVWLIHDQHSAYRLAMSNQEAEPVRVERLRGFFPTAAAVAEGDPRRGGKTVVDESGTALGYVIQTSPRSDHIVGYSGPTNCLLAFDTANRIVGFMILSSGDTRDHVDSVVRDERFLTALNGLTWEEAARPREVDAVSGATLTSLAVLESISYRLSGTKPSLRFPDEITLAEARAFFPEAVRMQPRAKQPLVHDLFDSQGALVGSVLRTSPAADDIMGYQGPTDTLIALAADGRVAGIVLRSSFDNDRYVGFVRDDEYFRALFDGKSLEQLSVLDVKAAEIEGVSGATMTSMAVAHGLPKAARAALSPPPTARSSFAFRLRDAGTVAVIACALVMSFTNLRGVRSARIAFQLVLIGYLGFLNGDLLSQALLVGWAQNGVAWRSAPGLAVLSAAALLVPILTKRQVYCHHICPFGAAQQLIRNRARRRLAVPRSIERVAQVIPVVLMAIVILTAMRHWPLNLASIEPFDAFVFWVAGAGTILVAIVGLAVSAFIPMAYCRYGCPTGAVLTFVRYNASSGQVSKRDWVAGGLLLLALALRFTS